MYNITSLFSNTPFADGTFDFYATVKDDPNTGIFYTPRSITGWEFVEEFNEVNAKAYILHDIAHAIDLYMREKQSRLLVDNFGWVLSSSVNKIPRDWMLVEVNATIIQYMISPGIVGTDYNPTAPEILFNSYNDKTLTPFANDLDHWDEIWQPVFEKYKTLGTDYFIDVWKSVSKFVRENRKEIPA